MLIRPYIIGLIAAFSLGAPMALADEVTSTAPATLETASGPSAALLQRKAELLTRIEGLKAAGVGVGPYMKQMEQVDELLHSGGPEAQALKRFDSISGALKDQTDRMETMKNYHPTASTSSPSSAGGGLSGASSAALIDSVKGKFGGQLPGGLNQEEVMKMLQNNPKAQEVLNKLK
jgi:hypothetical protein